VTTPQPPQSSGGEPRWGFSPSRGGPPPPPGQQLPFQPPPPGQGYAQQPSAAPPGPGGYLVPPDAAGIKSSKKKRFAPILLVIFSVVLLVFAYFELQGDVVNAETGDCIHVESATDFEVVDCATPEAQYKVLSVVDGLSSGALCDLDPDYDSAIEITGDTTKSLCLQTWLQVGDCVQTDGSWAECGSAESAYEVNEVMEDTQDEAGCPATTAFVRVYENENNVICLTEPA